MATQNSAQNSIAIHRLRNGDSLILKLLENGNPLFQSITDAGTPIPDWTVAANQPAITVSVVSVRGNAVTIASVKWIYNGITLSFSSSGACTTTGYTSIFSVSNNGATLNIIGNLASSDNTAADNIDVEVVARLSGIEYTLTAGKTVTITPMSSSGYIGILTANRAYVDSENKSSTITARLYQDGSPVSGFSLNVIADDKTIYNGIHTDGDSETFTVSQNMIDGEQLFIVDFFIDSVGSIAVARQAIRISDLSDEYNVILYIPTSSPQEVDTGSDVTVKAKLVKTDVNGVMTDITDADAQSYVMKIVQPEKDSSGNTWTVLATANTNEIKVTTEHTDRDGTQRDVEVICNVTF
jgi:hypothetical protein